MPTTERLEMRRDPTVVLVCRGCCCGNRLKHPGIDHDAQLASIEAAVARLPGGVVRVTECLGQCSSSNVVVVRAARPDAQWIGNLLGPVLTASFCAWLTDGGPGTRLPDQLALLAFRHHAPRELRVRAGA